MKGIFAEALHGFLFSRLCMLTDNELGNSEEYGKGMAFYFTDGKKEKSEIFIPLIDRDLWKNLGVGVKKRLAMLARIGECNGEP